MEIFCNCGKLVRRSAGEGNRDECSTCRKKKWRNVHPVSASYRNFITNSRRRSIPNNVTLEQYVRFCITTGYLYLRMVGIDVTIDRKRSTEGYSIGNMQLLLRSDNSRKQAKEIPYALARYGKKQPGDVF